MKASTLTRAADIAPAGGEFTSMESVRDRDLILLRMESQTTQYGEGFLLHLAEKEGEEPFQVLTTAMVVVKQLTKLQEDKFAFPCIVRFEKPGKAWLIV